VDGIRTLANVVIIDLIRVNLVSQTTLFHGVVVTMAVQVKERLYHDYYPTNMFLPFAIEVFGCLH
jgi:hypothetical protein